MRPQYAQAPTFQASRPAPGLPLRPPGPASGRQIVGLLWAGARWPERPAEEMQDAWPELRRVVWRTCCADPRIGPNFVLLHSAKEVLAADVLDLQRVDPAMFELLMEQPVALPFFVCRKFWGMVPRSQIIPAQ